MIDQYLNSGKRERSHPLAFIGHLQSFEIIQATVIEGEGEAAGEAELHSCVENVDQTGIPVKDGQKIMDHHNGTKEIGIVRVPFGAIEKGPKTIDLH